MSSIAPSFRQSCAAVAFVFVLGFAASCSRRLPPTDMPAEVRKCESLEESVRDARDLDLPSLTAADRVVIERPRSESKNVTITDAAVIAGLREALVPAVRTPSGGESEWIVGFYRGSAMVRSVWVYGDGEWGFERPGTCWTTGKNRLLVERLAAAVAPK